MTQKISAAPTLSIQLAHLKTPRNCFRDVAIRTSNLPILDSSSKAV